MPDTVAPIPQHHAIFDDRQRLDTIIMILNSKAYDDNHERLIAIKNQVATWSDV